ncbi:hypothetical protein Tco_1520342 [Tanacetum coccineum]
MKIVPVSPKEPTKKPAKKLERAKKDVPAIKSSRKSQDGVIIKDTPGVSVSKKKAQAKGKRSKGIEILFDAAVMEAAQFKEATKRSKKHFHISHTSGSGDGSDFELGVPDEQQRKISSINEGSGTKPGVPDVPKYDSESEKESWGDSGEEYNDDEDDTEDESDNDGNDDDGDNDDNDDNDYDDEVDIHNPRDYKLNDEEDNANNAKEENEDEEDDAEELYRDINVNLRKEDVEMTDAD